MTIITNSTKFAAIGSVYEVSYGNAVYSAYQIVPQKWVDDYRKSEGRDLDLTDGSYRFGEIEGKHSDVVGDLELLENLSATEAAKLYHKTKANGYEPEPYIDAGVKSSDFDELTDREDWKVTVDAMGELFKANKFISVSVMIPADKLQAFEEYVASLSKE